MTDGEEPADESQADEPVEEEEQIADPHRDRSITFRIFAWLVDNLITLLGVGLIAGFVGAGILGIEIPRNVRIVGIGSGVTVATIGRFTSKKTKELLWNDDLVWIVDVDARDPFDAHIYNEPLPKFREWEIEEQGHWPAPNLVFLRDVNYLEKTARGTWPGTLPDRELLVSLSAVAECRGQLEQDAKEGFAIKAQAFTMLRSGIAQGIEQILGTFQKGTLPDNGEGLSNAIDQAIEDFGIERSLTEEGDDSPSEDVPGIEVRIDDLEDLATVGRNAANGGGSGD